MESFHHKQLSVYRIVELIDQRRRFGNIGIRKQDVPSRLFPLYPFSHPLSIVRSCQIRYFFDESSQPLPQLSVVRGFTRVIDEKDLPKLSTKRSAHGFGHLFDLAG